MIRQRGLPYFPEAAWHEIAFGVLLIGVIVLLAIVAGPPHLDNPPNPANVNAYPRPDWYLLWYYALLALLRPAFEPFFIVLAPLLIFLGLFLVPFISHSGQRSPLRRPWAPAIVVLVVILVGALWRYGAVAPWSPNFNARELTAQETGASSGPIADGATLFYQKGCQFCHTVDGQGGIRGPDLTHVADRLSTGEIAAMIADGPGAMPSYVNNLTPSEMNAIIAFLESQGGHGTPTPVAGIPPGSVEGGQ
jgi:ubiquinol-cytochrome c reductase cytochrome b subunit